MGESESCEERIISGLNGLYGAPETGNSYHRLHARGMPPSGSLLIAASQNFERLYFRMKKIGFLSFGHWTPSPQSQTRSAADALLQSIDLAVAAEELGADGAYFRVHHFARQLASPFPAAGGCRRQDQPHRDRHGGHRHALREPALHGRGRRRRRPHRRRTAATRHQPRLARAGDRRLALFRLSPGRGRERRRHGPAPRGGVPRRAARRGFREAQPAADVPQSAGPAAPRAAFARACASGSGGAPAPTPRRSGRRSSA